MDCASASCDETSSVAEIRTDAANDLDDLTCEIGQTRAIIGVFASTRESLNGGALSFRRRRAVASAAGDARNPRIADMTAPSMGLPIFPSSQRPFLERLVSTNPPNGRSSLIQFGTNRNDRSWQHRSYYCCHFVHGLEEGHGNESAARSLCERANARGVG
jgi:hypothetical protein